MRQEPSGYRTGKDDENHEREIRAASFSMQRQPRAPARADHQDDQAPSEDEATVAGAREPLGLTGFPV
jgi:hypothetical protein